jgi:hypothetical protein
MFLLLFYAYGDDDDGGDDVDDDDGEVNGVHNKLDKDEINVQRDYSQVVDKHIHMDDADNGDENDEKSVVNEHVLGIYFH